MINTNAYNKLPLVSDASTLFDEQLASAGITRNQLFDKLAPLFVDGNGTSPYAACLIHHHYDLKPGERMVSNNLTTKPLAMESTELNSSPANVIAHCWLRTGEAIEYRLISESNPPKSTRSFPPPPPAEFFGKFRALLDPMGIDVLGICYADSELEDGFFLLETDGPGDRERVFTIIPRSEKPAPGYEVTWIPMYSEDGQSYKMKCACNCTGKCIDEPVHTCGRLVRN